MRVPEFSAGPARNGHLSNSGVAELCVENIVRAWEKCGYAVNAQIKKISIGGGQGAVYEITSDLIQARAVSEDDLNLAKAQSGQGAY